MHGKVDVDILAGTNHAVRRTKVIDFFTKEFEENNFKDEWVVAIVILLDRLAVSSVLRSKPKKRKHEDIFAEWLAAMLVVLKMSQVTAELELDKNDPVSLKDIVFFIGRLPKTSEWWTKIVLAEFRICHLLDYHMAVPTPLDMALRLALDICGEANKCIGKTQWAGLVGGTIVAIRTEFDTTTPRFVLLVSFLVELAVAHAYRDIYQGDTPPIMLSFAALHLALHSFGTPPSGCTEKLAAAKKNVTSTKSGDWPFPRMGRMLLSLWKQAPGESKVVEKWKRRERAIGGPFPSPHELPPGIDTMDELPTAPKMDELPKAPTQRSHGAMQPFSSRGRNRLLVQSGGITTPEPVPKLSVPVTPNICKEGEQFSKSETIVPMLEFEKQKGLEQPRTSPPDAWDILIPRKTLAHDMSPQKHTLNMASSLQSQMLSTTTKKRPRPKTKVCLMPTDKPPLLENMLKRPRKCPTKDDKSLEPISQFDQPKIRRIR